MSPEQLQGEPTDTRSDIFSFGVLLYECLSGRLPFLGETPEWEQLVERCLAKAPDQRFHSMAELLQSLL